MEAFWDLMDMTVTVGMVLSGLLSVVLGLAILHGTIAVVDALIKRHDIRVQRRREDDKAH